MTALATPDDTLARYDEDFALWAAQQAAILRAIGDPRLDIENIAEELEGMSRAEARAIRGRMSELITHLLKWHFQPEARSHSWLGSIEDARSEIADALKDSPSLRRKPAEVLDVAYRSARDKAITETGLAARAFPQSCPYTATELLDDAFFPGPALPALED